MAKAVGPPQPIERGGIQGAEVAGQPVRIGPPMNRIEPLLREQGRQQQRGHGDAGRERAQQARRPAPGAEVGAESQACHGTKQKQ